MKKQLLAWVACSAVAAACQSVAVAWPAPAGGASAAFVRETTLLVGCAGALFGLIVASIAWRSRAWAPSLLALGCLSMATGGIARFVFADTGLGLRPGAGAGAMPLLGLLLGGVWFFLATQTCWPTGSRESRRVRVLLAAGVMPAIGGCVALALMPSLAPSPHTARVLAGLVAPGYLFAGYRFFSVWRFLRLPSQIATAVGAAIFAPATIMAAAGGLPGLHPWHVELIMLAIAALPVSGFIIEQRARPGLRTMIFGLFLPGAIDNMRRGYPRQMTALTERIGAYDGALRGHVDRVADLSTRIAINLGMDAAGVREVMLASQLHDVGKLFIPRAILAKPGKLDDAERTIVQRHSALGADVVARVPELAAAARGVGEHHERWAGSGYPANRRGDEIAQAARIIAVADVYDALRSTRSYKREWGVNEALSEIERQSGIDFEPRVVYALLRLVANGADAADAPASSAQYAQAA